MSQVRLRRLQSDFERLTDLTRRHPRIAMIQAIGAPPDRYQLRFEVKSLRKSGESIKTVNDHLVEISLPTTFPRTPPLCRMMTPVFHPNIAPHAICIGDHWSPGESLSALVIRIAEMLAFQSYNTRSPLNGEAAKWVEQNLATLPIDSACMTIDEPAAPPAAPQSVGVADLMTVACSACGSNLRLPTPKTRVRVRCPRCRELTDVNPPSIHS